MHSMSRVETLRYQFSSRGILILSAYLSFPVIGLDQFIRTPPGQFSARPGTEIAHWIADSMMGLPLFAVGVLVADRIAGRARIGLGSHADVVKRALLITAVCAIVVAPAWFQVDRTEDPATVQPLVFPHASDSGDVYWVAPAVILTLTCTCLMPLAAWAGHRVGRGLTRATAIAVLVAAVPAAAWLLHQAAGRAYASRVYEARALLSVPPRPHAVHSSAPRSPASGPQATAAPGALAYQIAHALQDGLAGQAAGLPVAIAVLILGGRALAVSTLAGQLPATQPSGIACQELACQETPQEDE